MTKKKHSKSEDSGVENTNDTIENKDINLQEDVKVGDLSGKQPEEQDADNNGTESQVKEAAGIKDSDKEAFDKDSLLAKMAEIQDRYLRLSAEFDNYRKRTLREKIELTKHAGENILINIVPVLDDFERALKLMSSSTDTVAMKSGIDLIYTKFQEFLKQHGITEIEALNKDFNVDLHDAITKVPAEDPAMKGKVVDVVQKGYYLHDKILRHSKVVVGE
jgi:molecular chaperone GrpE